MITKKLTWQSVPLVDGVGLWWYMRTSLFAKNCVDIQVLMNILIHSWSRNFAGALSASHFRFRVIDSASVACATGFDSPLEQDYTTCTKMHLQNYFWIRLGIKLAWLCFGY